MSNIITTNKKAYHNYKILNTLEAGIVLNGPEVKSIKSGNISLKGSYVTIDKNHEPYVINLHIGPYKPANQGKDYNPTREKKLLLKKRQISRLIGKINQKGISVIPLKVYTKNGIIKLEIGIGKGKKKYDKKEKIKKREVKRKINKRLKQY